jgi:hypothetical protein
MAMETVAILSALVGTVVSLVPQLATRLRSRWSKGESATEDGKSFVVTIKEPSGKTIKVQTVENVSSASIIDGIQKMSLRQPKNKKQRTMRTSKGA